MFVPTLTVLLAAFSGCVATSTTYDTIVIGLGAAGATAASTLARAGRRVLALEAQDRVGGRVRSEDVADGVVELGAEWIHGLSPSVVYDAAVQHKVPVLQQDMPAAVFRSDDARRDEELTELFNYCAGVVNEGSDQPESMGQLVERKLRQYLAETKPELLKDAKLVEQFLDLMDRHVNTVDSSSSFHDVTTQSTFEHLNGSLYGSWHRHGFRTFFEILLNTYNGGEGLPSLDIKLKTEVTGVQWSARGVLVRCADGAQYQADNVILTVSLGVLKERHASLFSPPLPQEKVAAIESISMGLLDKVVLVFDEPRPASGWNMFYWTADDVSKLPAEDRWLAKFMGSSTPAGANNTVTLWIAGDGAKFMETLPEEVVMNKAVELLQRFTGSDVTVPRPVAMLRSTWYSNPFTRGTYTFDNVETPKRPGLRDALATPLVAGGAPRVLFAGEATSNKHFLTVHGASETGTREAQRLLAGQ